MSSSGPGTPGRTSAWETVYVFVSSTFNDMHGERDYLVKQVFPVLRDWCEQRKLRLVDIDLRWGVTETDATRNKNVVQVCLERIDQARPFFICFLGQRYGWVPKEKDVAQQTFTAFPGLDQAVAENSSATEMEVLHALLRKPFDNDPGKRLPMDHAFFYMRTLAYLGKLPKDPVPLRRIYADAAEPNPAERRWLLNKRKRLRQRIREESGRPVRLYGGRWNPEARTPELALPLRCPSSQPENRERWRQQWREWAGVETRDEAVVARDEAKARDFNDRLCSGRLEDLRCAERTLAEVIIDDLKAAILARYPDRMALPEQDELDREIDRHEDFVRTAADVFIERESDFADLDAYAGADSQRLFVLVAKAGLGKSTLLANWVARWRSREGKPADETVHARFVGVGERSGTVDALLRSILEELRRTGKLASEIPDNGNVLRSKFCELLGECGKKGCTVVVIDALNQLQSGLSDLEWVARTLPENVKLIVSFKLGDAAGDAMAAQLRADERVTLSEVRPFAGLEERRQLVRQFLRQFLKELDEQHLEALIQADGADNPLFLKVVLTELRVFGAFGQLGEVIRREFGTTPQSAFEAVLRRLESDPSYAAVPSAQAVPLLFGLLAHSRSGLPEDLLARMFLAELGLGEERLADMAATIQLFLRQVRPFLARRDGRVDFFYESFQLAAWTRYTGEGAGQRPEAARHGQLAKACQKWKNFVGPSRRYALGNLVQHELTAGNDSGAGEALTDFEYHYERLHSLGREDVANVTGDFAAVSGVTLPPLLSERVELWSAFHGGNSHFLRRVVRQLAPETYFLQLAAAHADTSPVTAGAEKWLETTGSEVIWLRLLRRPHRVEGNACLRTFEGHLQAANAITVLSDGKRAISTESGGTLRLWDLETGQCRQTFVEDSRRASILAVSPDGKRTISAEGDGTLRLWDLETGQCRRTFVGHSKRVCTVAVLPDGKRAISASWDCTLKLWDLESGACLQTLVGHSDGVKAVVALPDARRAISASGDKTLKLWDLKSGACLRTFAEPPDGVDTIAFSPDGRRVVSASGNGALKLWDLESAECLRTFVGHSRRVRAVAFLPDGKRIVSAGGDKALKLWDLDTGQCLRTFAGHWGWANALAIVPDGRRAISFGHEGPVQLWDLDTDPRLRDLPRHSFGVSAVALLPKGRYVLSASSDSTLKLWVPESGDCLRTFVGHSSRVMAVAVMADGKRAVSGSEDKTLKLWDLDTGQCLQTFVGHSYYVNAVALLPDGKRAISGSFDTTLRLWNLDSGECLRHFAGHSHVVSAVALLPDGKRAISASFDTLLRLWDLESGQCLQTLEGHSERVLAVTLLPYGKRAVSASEDKTLKLWDLDTGQCLRTFVGHSYSVNAVTLLRDGKRTVSASLDNTLKLWDLDTGECLQTFEGHSGPVESVAVLPDGKRTVSASLDNTLKVWDLDTGRCLATYQANSPASCSAVASDTIVIGTLGGEVLFLKLMLPGRIVPETIAATWHPSRPLLAVARANGTLLLQAWHPESQVLEELARTAAFPVAQLQWSTSGAHLLATARDGTTHVLDATTLQPASLPACPWSAPRDISPDGRWHAVIEAGQLRIVPATEA